MGGVRGVLVPGDGFALGRPYRLRGWQHVVTAVVALLALVLAYAAVAAWQDRPVRRPVEAPVGQVEGPGPSSSVTDVPPAHGEVLSPVRSGPARQGAVLGPTTTTTTTTTTTVPAEAPESEAPASSDAEPAASVPQPAPTTGSARPTTAPSPASSVPAPQPAPQAAVYSAEPAPVATPVVSAALEMAPVAPEPAPMPSPGTTGPELGGWVSIPNAGPNTPPVWTGDAAPFQPPTNLAGGQIFTATTLTAAQIAAALAEEGVATTGSGQLLTYAGDGTRIYIADWWSLHPTQKNAISAAIFAGNGFPHFMWRTDGVHWGYGNIGVGLPDSLFQPAPPPGP